MTEHELKRFLLTKNDAVEKQSMYQPIDKSKPCAPTQTQCWRCNNPFNACDHGAPNTPTPEAPQ